MLYLYFGFEEKDFNNHWLEKSMDRHVKKSELDIKELETSLKFCSGILVLHVPTLNVRAGYTLEAVRGARYHGFGNQTWV